MGFSKYGVEAYVLNEVNGVYSLKVESPSLGMYITGMTMRMSKKNDNWWMQPPRHLKFGRYYADVEFDTRTDLWQEMYDAAIAALKEWQRNSGS